MDKTIRLLLQAANIVFMNVLWCDYANIIRGKAYHRNLFEPGGSFPVSISKAQLGVSACGDYVVPHSPCIPVGEIFLKPDWDTLRILPYLPGFASVYGEMAQRDQEELIDPRIFLKKAIYELSQYGITIKMAFENEFTLLDKATGEPIDDTLFASPSAIMENGPFITRLSDALEKQGLEIERFYPESGYGQYELTTRYTDALEAADNQILFRQTVHGVSAQCGYAATFLPKYAQTQAGNGCHVHFSLWKDDRNLFTESFGKENRPDSSESFVAGVLESLPSLMALTVPSPNSFHRLKPHCWSGAYRCWGIDNREAALRAITPPELPLSARKQIVDHFELKTCDASSNPFLALAGLILCGVVGIERGLALPPPFQKDPGFSPEEELTRLKIDRLPSDLMDCIRAFENNSALTGFFHPIMKEAIIAVRKEEYAKLNALPFTEQTNLLKGRY